MADVYPGLSKDTLAVPNCCVQVAWTTPSWTLVRLQDEIHRKFPGGVDKVLEMIGTVTVEVSLHCAKQDGIALVENS